MKYYKRIKHDIISVFNVGKIYPEDYKIPAYNSVLESIKDFPERWQEVPAGDFYVQEGKMPEYFAIKRVTDNPLWEEYIDWLNVTYNTNWGGTYFNFYGYDNYQHYGGTDSKHYKEDFKNNPVELTLEQWDQIMNKNKQEEVMNKEIIGWKLKDGCEQYTIAALNIIRQDRFYIFAEGYNFSSNSTNAADLKKAGVLELWFDPVYSQKFKVGDWVTIENSKELQSGCRGCKEGTYQVISKPMDDSWSGLNEDDNGFFVKTFDEIWRISNIGVRLATPKEIKATQFPQITINGYKGEFFPEYVKFGCVEIDKDVFILLYESKGGKSNRVIESVTIGKGAFTKDQIKEIAAFYLNKK